MSPNIFRKRLLGPSASELRHKQIKIDATAPPTPELNYQLLTVQNGILMSLIDHNSPVSMVVWSDFVVKTS